MNTNLSEAAAHRTKTNASRWRLFTGLIALSICSILFVDILRRHWEIISQAPLLLLATLVAIQLLSQIARFIVLHRRTLSLMKESGQGLPSSYRAILDAHVDFGLWLLLLEILLLVYIDVS